MLKFPSTTSVFPGEEQTSTVCCYHASEKVPTYIVMFVMVSRDNLLNRYSDVDDEGKFVSEIGSGRARFLTVADQLLSGKKDSTCIH